MNAGYQTLEHQHYQPFREESEAAVRMVTAFLRYCVKDVRDREEILNDVLHEAMRDYKPGRGKKFTSWCIGKIRWVVADYFDNRKNQTEIKNVTELMPALQDDHESVVVAATCRAREGLEGKLFMEHLAAGLRKHRKKGEQLVDFLLLKVVGFETGEIAKLMNLTTAQGSNLRDVFVDHLEPLVEEYLGMSVYEYLGRPSPNK